MSRESFVDDIAMFAPKELEEIAVGKFHVLVYPRVTPDMPHFELAHAYHVAKSALGLLSITPAQFLDTMGNRLNCSTTVDGFKFDWLNYLDENWTDWTNLTVLSFHNSSGRAMNNATVANTMVLKPVANQNNLNRRPEDVAFVRVRLILDFRPLMKADQDNRILESTFYLQLPQDSITVQDHTGADLVLTTYHGPDDITSLSVEEVRTQILQRAAFAEPLQLTASAAFVSQATIDSTSAMEAMRDRVLKMALPTILREIFDTICPNYSAKPHAVIESIKQWTVDKDGNTKVQTIREYYTRFSLAARPFAQMKELPVDLCSLFIHGMHPRYKPSFEEKYPRHAEPHDRAGRAQRAALSEIYKQAVLAEGNVKTVESLVADYTGQQTLMTTAQSYSSRAERTLETYQGNGGGGRGGDKGRGGGRGKGGRGGNRGRSELPEGFECDGCGGHHRFLVNGEINCPNAHKDGVIAKGYKAKADREKKWARGRSPEDRKRNKRWNDRSPDFSDLSESNKKKMARQVMEAIGVAGSDDEKSSDEDAVKVAAAATSKKAKKVAGILKKGSSKPTFTFLFDIIEGAEGGLVLNSNVRLPPLPAAIDNLFLHAPIQFGTTLGAEDCPTVLCVVDTAAALTTGNLWFCMKLAKAFPHIVAKVHTKDECSPLTLKGVVESDGDGKVTTTELPMAFTFHLPYRMLDGAPTSLTIACGPHVAVNVILGLPFIKATQMVIDAFENVAECRLLDHPPFPLECKRARVEVPQVEGPINADAHKCEAMLATITALEAIWACVYAMDPATGVKIDAKKRKASEERASNGDDVVPRVSFDPDPNGVLNNYGSPDDEGTGDDTDEM
jgi:hypothetical protein